MNNKLSQAAPIAQSLRLRSVIWPSDLAAMIKIEQADFASPWDNLRFLRFSAQINGVAIVGEVGDTVVGYVLYEHHGQRRHIVHIAVDPAHQSLGIGRQMLIPVCDQAGPTTLYVRRGNGRAQALYLRFGFIAVGCRNNHYDDGEDAVVMAYQPVKSSASLMLPTGFEDRSTRPIGAGALLV